MKGYSLVIFMNQGVDSEDEKVTSIEAKKYNYFAESDEHGSKN